MTNLKGRSLRGGAVMLSGQAVKFVLQMGSTAIIARLLTPGDFGLVAMVAAFMGFVGLFNDMGLSAATVQSADVSHEQVSTVFWINVAVGVGLAAIGVAMAPGIAWFYSEPRLARITVLLSVGFIFGGLTAQHYALLVRRMRFGAMTFVQTGSFAFGALIGITGAVLGWGYWSLVAMGLATSMATTVLSWILSGWRPSAPARSVKLKAMLSFGGALTGSSVLTYAVRNLDNVVVGRACGMDSLGLYSKSYSLVLMPIQQISSPLNGVFLPALSRLQNQPNRYRTYYLGGAGLLALVSMPLVAFAYSDAHTIVLTILGQGWISAVPLFRLLAPGAFVGTIAMASDWLLISLGRTDRLLKWSLISAPLTVLAFLFGVHWGAAGVAAAFSLMSCILVIPMFWWTLRRSPIRLLELASAVWRPAAASTLAAVALAYFISKGFFAARPPLQLAMDALIHLCAYAMILLMLPGGRRFFATTASIFAQRARA